VTEEQDNSTLPLPVILALDTSSRHTSLAIARGPELVANFEEELDEKRSERLWTEIDLLLGRAAIALGDIDVIAVCIGPGGFTGLRVGIAAAKGLALALNEPVIGVGSLEAAAFSASHTGLVLVVSPAYRGDVYAQLFTCAAGEIPRPRTEPIVSLPADVVNLIRCETEVALVGEASAAEVLLVGEAAPVVANALAEVANKLAAADSDSLLRVSPTAVQPSVFLASSIAKLGYLKTIAGGAGKAEDLRALYVRPSDAEIKLSKGLLGVKHRA
jgi:tRNA threonylcarbamoyladenosine biosynthesis protein TsaB